MQKLCIIRGKHIVPSLPTRNINLTYRYKLTGRAGIMEKKKKFIYVENMYINTLGTSHYQGLYSHALVYHG